MKFHIALLLSSTAVLFSFGATQAAPLQGSANSLEVHSFAELLEPIPNALEKLRIDDLTRREARPSLIPAQFDEHHHHHHHHHHHFDDDGPADIIGGVLGGILAPPAPPPECYWTEGRPYWDGYGWVRRRVQVCE